ncbi:MAG: autotransporter-associated beta strand repeat-containing protein [Luteolibacter sp.]
MKPSRMNPLNWSRSAGIALTAALVTVCCSAVHAADWNGSTSTDWNIGSNWSGGTVPNNEGVVVNTTTGNIATLSSNAPDVGELAVGLWFGTGLFNHVGGSINATVRVLIGAGQDAIGTYNLANTATTGGSLTGFGTGTGSLTTPEIFLGDPFGASGSHGTFNINTSGTVATTNNFGVGFNSSTPSTVNLDTGTITVGQELQVGANTGGIGVFNQSGGSVATTGLAIIGNATGSTGTYNLTAGSLSAGTELWVGQSGTGTFNQSAGTVSSSNLRVGQNGTGTFAQSGGTVAITGLSIIGNATGSTGTYNLTGGSLSSDGELWVGQNGTATFNQSAGTVSSANWFVIGRDNGGNGTYNQSGGTVNAATGGGQTVLSSFTGGTSTLNVSGGTFNATNDLFVGEGGNGTLNVSGTGTVTTGEFASVRVAQAGGAGVVNLNGGTLQTSGVAKGGGSSAVVNFNGGTLKASAYQSVSGLTHAYVKAGGAVIDTNGFDGWVGQDLEGDIVSTGGGLTKNGAGTLTLAGANTYTGNTKVNAGTLSINSACLADSADVTIAAGATLNLDHGDTDTIGSLIIAGAPVAFPALYRASDANGGSAPGTPLDSLTGTGKLQVTGPATPGYAGWAASHVGGAASNQDTDQDGVANGVEYFMNAATGFTANPSVVVTGAVRTVTWTNGGNIPATDYAVQFVVQTSADLVNWTSVNSGDPNLSNTSGSVTYTITGSGKQFVRLKVTPN